MIPNKVFVKLVDQAAGVAVVCDAETGEEVKPAPENCSVQAIIDFKAESGVQAMVGIVYHNVEVRK